jgi:hypothetical protein
LLNSISTTMTYKKVFTKEKEQRGKEVDVVIEKD